MVRILFEDEVQRWDEQENDRGTLTAPPLEWLATGVGSHCFQTDPSNRFAFCADLCSRS